jgi:DNA-3-methyladenine glycosylase
LSGAPDLGWLAGPAREVAPALLGWTLLHEGVGGPIVETEAYEEHEPACHAYAGRTARTWPLFGPAGHAYVYLSYGIHRLFNVVTGPEGRGEAVLVRALEPRHGLGSMRVRRGGVGDRGLCSGPGKLAAALAIGPDQNGIRIGEGVALLPPADARPRAVIAGPRVGISKAIELPWRFCLADSGWLSRPAGAAALSPSSRLPRRRRRWARASPREA